MSDVTRLLSAAEQGDSGATTSIDADYNGLDPVDVSVTNTDNDVPPAKFYVVDDGGPDRNYEYGSTGSAIENFALNNANTAPRRAASDKVWVVDANKKVYVYETSGALLGSSTAGSLHAAAQVEGIATNGTDIWIVDAKQAKVFRYTGAASRLSGSQNAASSFNLNGSNIGRGTSSPTTRRFGSSTTRAPTRCSTTDAAALGGQRSPAGWCCRRRVRSLWTATASPTYGCGRCRTDRRGRCHCRRTTAARCPRGRA
jgi:hypothetical protein